MQKVYVVVYGDYSEFRSDFDSIHDLTEFMSLQQPGDFFSVTVKAR